MIFCTFLAGLGRQPQGRVSQLEWQAVEAELQLARERQLERERSARLSPATIFVLPQMAGVFLLSSLSSHRAFCRFRPVVWREPRIFYYLKL